MAGSQELESRYFAEPLLAFVRGRLQRPDLPAESALTAAREAGLRLTKFKRSRVLPRVQKVIGVLHGLQPARLLDIGSGRGTFLWPLLEAIPELPVTAIEIDAQRAADLAAISAGGLSRLTALEMDVQSLNLEDDCFDVVTLLEVLEHLPDPGRAAAQVLRVARSTVIVSVPSKADENPEHRHLFSPDDLKEMFLEAGAGRVTVEHVLNHRLAVIRK